MKFIVLIIIFIISCSALTSLDWEIINPYPTGNCLRDVQFIDSLKTGWSVGDCGTIVKTSDAGDSWVVIDLDTRINLTGIYLLDENKCWIVGDSGLILHTSDGGENWTVQSSGLPDHFSDVNFSDSLHGCAVGKQGVIYVTQDGGNNWTKSDSFTHLNLQSVYFSDSLSGWAAGEYGIILHTVNGGLYWAQQSSSTSLNLYEIEFYNNQIGWCVGHRTSLKTTNGGSTWYNINFPIHYHLRSISIVDSLNLWAFAQRFHNTYIYRSTDGGDSWFIVSSHSYVDFWSLCFNNNDDGWIVGDAGYIFHLTSQGTFWERKNNKLGYGDFYDVFFLNDTLGWIIAEHGDVFRTTDGGITFDSFYTSYDHYKSIFFTDENKGCAVGWLQDMPDWMVSNMYTIDGGVNWIEGDWPPYNLCDVFFISESLGWAVEIYYPNGKIYKSTDFGVNWNLIYSCTFAPYSIHFANCSQGWIVGTDGNILTTTDSGTTWTQQVSNTSDTLNSVFFLDINIGYATGENGTVLKTTDGGNQWTVQATNISGDLNKIVFLNPDAGWAGGDTGIMISTTDGGITWHEENSRTNQDLLSITLVGSTYIWAVGRWNIITRANIESSGIEEQNPVICIDNFQIQYTSVICNGVIEFEVQTTEKGNLEIYLYNTAGQNLGVILNKRINAGTNQFTINLNEVIGNLPSGIYFMNISADNEASQFRQQNKLLLIN